MKMENVLHAPRDCVVAAIRAEPGASLAADQVILEIT
jgi:propionyl-CoA carboxylase alpha chain